MIKIVTILISIIMFVSCGQFSASKYKCSDESTQVILKQIIVDDLIEKTGAHDYLNVATDVTDLDKLVLLSAKDLSLEMIRADSHDQSIKKYECKAELSYRGLADQHKYSVEYSSQLDDDSDQLVELTGIEGYEDLVISIQELMLQKQMTSVEVESDIGEFEDDYTIAESATIEYSTEPPPNFEDYPVSSIYKSEFVNAEKILKAEDYPLEVIDLNYLSDISFAGKYLYTAWGCGSGCQSDVFINAQTGDILDLGNIEGFIEDMHPDSRLLVTRIEEIEGVDGQPLLTSRYYVLNQSIFELVHTESMYLGE